MPGKRERQEAVRRIIESAGGSTQEDIRRILRSQGIRTSQSTLSRDLRELGAVKVPAAGGKSVYRIDHSSPAPYRRSDMEEAKEEFLVSFEDIGNFLVIKTRPGNARDFCLVLDRQGWKEIVGTLAGDDTILVVARSPQDISRVMEKLKTGG